MGRYCLTWHYSKARVSKLFSVKSQNTNILDFSAIRMFSVATIQLCHFTMKAAMVNM